MNITDFIAILGAITGTLSLRETIRLNKKILAPKVKVNLERVNDSNCCSYHNLKIQNISDYNLYDFNVKLEEIEDLNVKGDGIKAKMKVLYETIPVFTIGQVYDTFLLNIKDNLNIEKLNFNITYRVKPNGEIKSEKITFNINALRNVYMKIN